MKEKGLFGLQELLTVIENEWQPIAQFEGAY